MPNLQRMVGHAGQRVATGFGTARIAGGGGDIARVASKQRGTAGNKLQPDVGKIRTLPPGGNRSLIGNGTGIELQDALYDSKDALLIAVKPY